MAETIIKKLGIFAKIRQEEDAVKVVGAASLAFFIAGGLFMILSYWYGPELLVDGIAYIVLGFLLRTFRSRIVAILLLLLAIVTVLLALKIFSGHGFSGGLNIILAAFVVWVGVRAVEATFKLRAKKPTAVPVGDA
jgi:hypothetical protein